MDRLDVCMLALSLLASTAFAEESSRRSDVRFSNGDVEFAGTLLMPNGDGPFPGLVLVPGSGPGERTRLLDVASRLAESDIAVLAYDKRGSGQSGGSWLRSSLTDLAADAAAAFRVLADQPEVDSRRSGYWGVSQGGWIVPLAANMSCPAFVIVVSGGGATPKEVEMARYRTLTRQVHGSGNAAAAAEELLAAYFDYLANSLPHDSLVQLVNSARSEDWFDALGIEQVIPSPDNRSNWEWVATFDPRPSIRELAVPTLVLLGARDPLTPAQAAAESWRESLPKTVENNRVIIFPEAGHAMRSGEHGGEFVDGYFTTLVDWLRTVGALPAGQPGLPQ